MAIFIVRMRHVLGPKDRRKVTWYQWRICRKGDESQGRSQKGLEGLPPTLPYNPRWSTEIVRTGSAIQYRDASCMMV